jgi:hypothetical protein
MANAFAMPQRREIGFTTRAAALLDDAELRAVAMHELGHLHDRGQLGKQLVLAALLTSLAMLCPLISCIGPAALLVPVAFVVALPIMAAKTRRGEERADAHVHAHEDGVDAGVYARALDRLHADSLVPAVLRGRGVTHPHLYDRMLKAGVQPGFERPLPPPRRRLQLAAHTVAAAVLMAAFTIVSEGWRHRVYTDEATAERWLVAGGGDVVAIGALGYHWLERDPGGAGTRLLFAAERSTWPEYSLRLALLLAPDDPAAARHWLARAEHDREQGPGDTDAAWFDDFVDAVREAIAEAERR